MTVVLTGQLCSGKNAVQHTRTGQHYPKPQFKAWRQGAMDQLAQQTIKNPTQGMPVTLKVEYWPGDLRTRDVSGMMDALMHLLVYAGIIEDDGLIYDSHWLRQPMNRKFPKTIITLHEWSGA